MTRTWLLSALPIIFTLSVACAQAQVRPEIRPIESVTLTTQQFLLGEHNGKPASLAGELRIPMNTSGQVPAVILVHGSGGLAEYHERLRSCWIAFLVAGSQAP